MLIAVDIGNTSINIGIFNYNEIIYKFRINTDKSLTSNEYFEIIKNILDEYKVNIDEIKDVAICSVVPSILPNVKNSFKKLINKEPFIINYKLETGIKILIDTPEKLGNDLLVGAVQALEECKKSPIIIIDMGTATTFAVVDKNKNYVGGLILPGIKISLDALCEKAQQIPEINLEKPKRLIGKNTIDCVRSGLIYGSVALIDKMVELLEKEVGEKAQVFITGGFSKEIVSLCESKIIYKEDLVLKGINTIYLKNKDSLKK